MKDMSYGKSDSGVAAAQKRNPNKHPPLNEAPDGPLSHMHAEDGKVGVEGSTEVKTSRGTFHFK